MGSMSKWEVWLDLYPTLESGGFRFHQFFPRNNCPFLFTLLLLRHSLGTHIFVQVLVCVLSRFSCVRFFVTLWTVARQVPLSMGIPRQEYWSGLPCPPPGDRPDPGIEPASLTSPALAAGFFTMSITLFRCPSLFVPAHHPQDGQY